MSTEIKDTVFDSDSVRLTRYEENVELVTRDRGTVADALVNRADFLAAVAKECDAIVIDRAELPPTGLTSDGSEVCAGNGDDATRWIRVRRGSGAARRAALAYLALAECLDANPPVDEAQVEALAHDLSAEGVHPEGFTAIARRLVERGWSK